MYILFICGDSKYILKAVLPPNFSFLLLKQLLFILLFNLRACEPLTDQNTTITKRIYQLEQIENYICLIVYLYILSFI